jgi:hypothetical protein
MSAATIARIFTALPDDPALRRAIIGCSAALELDDESAMRVIHLTAGAIASGEQTLWQIKSSGWVWERPDGTWRLLDGVRREGLSRLEREVGTGIAAEIRSAMLQAASRRVERASGDSAAAVYARRRAILELSYLRLRGGRDVRDAAVDLRTLWLEESPGGKAALARAMDHLASDLPEQEYSAVVQFFRGISAEERGERERALNLLSAAASAARDSRHEDLPMAAVALLEYARIVAATDPDAARGSLEESGRLWRDRGHAQRIQAVTISLPGAETA